MLCNPGSISCAAAAAVLDLPQQECQLLLDILAAVLNKPHAASSSGQPTALVPVHQLSLFLMAQLFDRDARKPETQDHWPDPQSNNLCAEALIHRSNARAACPGSPGTNNNLRSLMKSHLQQLQKQHQAYSKSYTEFLQRHQKVLLELVMDDCNLSSRGGQVPLSSYVPEYHHGARLAGATPSPIAAAAAAGGGPLSAAPGGGGLSSIRISTSRGSVAVAGGVVGEAGLSGMYRGTLVRGPADVKGDQLIIQDCIECHIYMLAPVRLARISNCTDCTVFIGAASTLLPAACTWERRAPPALLGDCRFVKLAPFNSRYESIMEHLAAAGLDPTAHNRWNEPLLMHSSSTSKTDSSGSTSQALQARRPGCSTPSSPHTHGAAERRNSAAAAAQKAVLLLEPSEFLPLVIPFSHSSQQGPLPAIPFPLPPEYDAALQQQYSVVTELRSRIRGSGLDEARRNQLQAVIQSHFREWLHSSGAIRQVYDLSKLEGDEYGPAGMSPPAALRDHGQL
eukprot:gene13625-13751_t